MNCELCGEPMPAGEEMFKYHGYSGPCPKTPLPKPQSPTPEAQPTSEAALLPCPFCGSVEIASFKSEYPDGLILYNVRCAKCYVAFDGQRKMSYAVAAWNTRAQSTPSEQRASQDICECGHVRDGHCGKNGGCTHKHQIDKQHPSEWESCKCDRFAPQPEAVRMPPRPEVYTDSTRNYRPRLIKPGQESAAVVYIEALEAELQTERAAHERTRAELGHSQQSKLRMFVWDGRGKYKVVSCANSVSEARALALEEMSLRGDLLNMRGHVEHEQPLIYHRANAELALTESGETEELNICLEAETKRRQTAEAELELLRAEVARKS